MEIIANAQIKLVGSLNGVRTENILTYGYDDVLTDVTSEAIALSFEANLLPSLLDNLTDSWVLQLLETQLFQKPPGVGSPLWVTAPNLPGEVVGAEVMPPHSTVRVIKVVDNSEKFPTTAPDFRNGFVGFSGFGEGQQNKGLLTVTAISNWTNDVQPLLTLPITDGVLGPIDMFMIVFRPVPGGFSDTVPVTALTVDGRVSTRVSRRYG